MTWPPAIGADPYFESERAVIYNGDCRELLPLFEDRAFDHAITDPPYSVHVHTNTRTNKGTDGASGGAEIDLGFDSLSADVRATVAHEIRRLVVRWSLVFCDVESTHLWRSDLCDSGILTAARSCASGCDGSGPGDQLLSAIGGAAADAAHRPHQYLRTGIWLKGGAMPQVTGDRPGSGFESIVVTHGHRESGRLRWNGGGKVGVWRERVPQRRDGRVHPSEKPWRLLRQLLRDFTDPGDTILDPFGGSGSLARAALDLPDRRVVLIEGDEGWCAQAASRLGAPVPEVNGQRGLEW